MVDIIDAYNIFIRGRNFDIYRRPAVTGLSIPVDSLEIEARWLKSRIKGHNEMIEKAYLPKQIFGQVPREPGFYIDYVCSHDELHVVVVNLGSRATDDAP